MISSCSVKEEGRGITSSPKHILIVDDEPGIRSALSRVIGNARPQYEIHTAESAEEALSLLKESFYDLLITDLRLPGMDGLMLAEAAHEIAPATWSIIMTGYGTEETHTEAYYCGCIAHVRKPFEVDIMIEWVDIALNRVPDGITPRAGGIGVDPFAGAFQALELMVAPHSNEKPWFTPKQPTTMDNPGQGFRKKLSRVFRGSS